MPKHEFYKGFIKIYAAFLGVDLGGALEEIDSLHANSKKAKSKKKLSLKKPPLPSESKSVKISAKVKKRILIVISAVVLLWVLVVVGGAVLRGVAQIFKAKPKQTKATTECLSTPIVSKGELLVSLTVKKKCFLKVIVDGKVYFDGLLTKGARETWKGKKEIELKLSDGSAVYLEVNGKTIPTLTSLPKPIESLKVTASGITVDK